MMRKIHMQVLMKKIGKVSLILLTLLFFTGAAMQFTATEVQAKVRNQLVTKNGKTYYYDENGKKYKGGLLTLNGKKYYFSTTTGVMQKGVLVTLNGKKYYFSKTTGAMRKGWVTFSKNRKRFFYKTSGAMLTGWTKYSSGIRKRYFSPKTGFMTTGWMTDDQKVVRYFDTKTGLMARGLTTISGKTYLFADTGAMKTGWNYTADNHKQYFNAKTGVMSVGWGKLKSGKRRYYEPTTGYMVTGMYKVDGKGYYFKPSNGYFLTGWLTYEDNKYYFDKTTGVMATGTVQIDGTTYIFDSDGKLKGSPTLSSGSLTAPTSTRTIKNYLAGAFQPIGQALYVWGGGWNDSTRKGTSPTMKSWYDSQNSSYDYQNYRDLSVANRAKGFDCSGFVGWAAYQVMQTKSNVGGGYTVVSGEVGSSYVSRGWGTIVTQATLAKTNYKLYPGDIGYNDGHTWIVVGQCSDKSVVVVHSTPQAGVQLSGTTTPSGSYNSQAVTLATKYMKKFSGYTKYTYRPSCGNFIRNGSYLRWSSTVLSDPDGFKNMTADQILAQLIK